MVPVRPLASGIFLKPDGSLGYENGCCEVRMIDDDLLGRGQGCVSDHDEVNETVRAAVRG